MQNIKKSLLGLLTILAIFARNQAFAGGFALMEQSASSQGTAYAGAASIAEDASTVWFNPAGLMRLYGRQAVVGLHYLNIVTKFDNKNTRNVLGLRIPGNDGGNAGGPAGIANSYLSWRFNECWAAGLGINSPFGLVTDYSGHWVGRYYAQRSAVLTININPTLAYRINDCWSIGAGFNAMYLHARLSNKIDFGLIGLSIFQAPVFGAPSSCCSDGYVYVKGNSWGYGGNVGILFEPCCTTRFGLTYRSEVKHHVKGRERFGDLPTAPQFAAISAGFQNTGAKAKVTLPSSITLSGYHEIDDNWAIVGDVMWTKWDVIKRLIFKFDNPNQADAVTTLKWKNAWRAAIGTIYTYDCNWKFRAGFAWDQDPTPNSRLRSARIPGDDRYWISLGTGYQWNECLHFDLAYTHVFVKTPHIDKSEFRLPENQLAGGLHGTYKKAYTDILSAQAVWNF